MVVAVIIIINQHFWFAYTGNLGSAYYYTTNCYLGEINSWTNLCYFNWLMTSIGGFFCLVVFFLSMCNTRGGRSPIFLAFFFIASGIFLAQGIVDCINIPTRDDGLQGWRNSIIGLAWAMFGVTALAVVVSLVHLITERNQPPPPNEVFMTSFDQQQYMYGGQAPPPPQYGAVPPPPYGAAAPPPSQYGVGPGNQYGAPPVYNTQPYGYPPAGYKPAV